MAGWTHCGSFAWHMAEEVGRPVQGMSPFQYSILSLEQQNLKISRRIGAHF